MLSAENISPGASQQCCDVIPGEIQALRTAVFDPESCGTESNWGDGLPQFAPLTSAPHFRREPAADSVFSDNLGILGIRFGKLDKPGFEN